MPLLLLSATAQHAVMICIFDTIMSLSQSDGRRFSCELFLFVSKILSDSFTVIGGNKTPMTTKICPINTSRRPKRK